MKVETRKKLHLGEYPTPLESMDNLTRKHGGGKVKLYIKRDDIAGPAYRVIVPAVIQIAYLRQKSLMLELSISPEQDDDDEINESDDE